MSSLLFLIPVALILGGLGLLAFLWSLKSNQYDDIQGAAYRILDDDDLSPQEQAKINARADASGSGSRRTPDRSENGARR